MFYVVLGDQMVKNCLHVATAARYNNGVIDDALNPLTSVTIRKDDRRGITASGSIHGRSYVFNEQEVVDAIALYWEHYHNLPANCVEIELSYDNGEFGADIRWVA